MKQIDTVTVLTALVLLAAGIIAVASAFVAPAGPHRLAAFASSAAFLGTGAMLLGERLLTELPAKSDGIRRTRWRPFSRAAYWFPALFIFALSSTLLLRRFGLDEGLNGATAKAQQESAHFVGAIVIPGLALAFWVNWQKSRARHRKLLRLERGAAALSSIAHSRQPNDRSNAVQLALKHLLAATEKMDYRVNVSVRSAWIWIPTKDGRRFRAVYYRTAAANHRGPYLQMAEHHRPHAWDGARQDGRNSLIGYVFSNGIRICKRISDAEAFDESYEHLLPSEGRERFKIRSVAAAPLACGRRIVGVLTLYDTEVNGFLESDSTVLRIWASLMAPTIAADVDAGA